MSEDQMMTAAVETLEAAVGRIVATLYGENVDEPAEGATLAERILKAAAELDKCE